ncbi:unnamed protein product, partial [Prorocentrum cordatum]
ALWIALEGVAQGPLARAASKSAQRGSWAATGGLRRAGGTRGIAETFHLTGAPGRRERGGRKGSRLSSVVSLNARPARESFAGASGVDAGNGTDFNFFSFDLYVSSVGVPRFFGRPASAWLRIDVACLHAFPAAACAC